jgi:hypothetical protein
MTKTNFFYFINFKLDYYFLIKSSYFLFLLGEFDLKNFLNLIKENYFTKFIYF